MTRPCCRRCGGPLRDGITSAGRLLRYCPACHALAKRKWKSAHPGADRAHKLVAKAIERGVLVRLPCEVCGDTTTEAHHHRGYSAPLDVRFLCKTHHRQAHRKGPGASRSSQKSQPRGPAVPSSAGFPAPGTS